MGKRGPAATPTATLKIRGSWRGDVRKNELQPESGRPRCPAWLRKDAKSAWKQLVPLLDNMGVLTKIDGNALARYCEMWARWRAVSEFVVRHGESFPIKDGQGNLVGFRSLPQARTASHLSGELLRLEQQFGLTPAARVGLTVGERPSTNDDKSRFFMQPA